MKLKREFISYHDGTESVLIPTGEAEFSGIVRGNRSFGAVLDLLTQDRTEDELIDALQQRYKAPRERLTADVRKALDALKEIGALDV